MEVIKLSNRETEVMELMADSYRINEIAEELFISPYTVKNHIKNITKKFNVSRRIQAISKYMYQKGMLGAEEKYQEN